MLCAGAKLGDTVRVLAARTVRARGDVLAHLRAEKAVRRAKRLGAPHLHDENGGAEMGRASIEGAGEKATSLSMKIQRNCTGRRHRCQARSNHGGDFLFYGGSNTIVIVVRGTGPWGPSHTIGST